MKVFSYIKKGINKYTCDDAVIINNQVLTDGALNSTFDFIDCVCIADGVGGNKGGHYASRFLLDSISKQDFHGFTTQKLREYFYDINIKLIQYGKEICCPTMATTFTGFFNINNKRYIVHIGNTRLYVMQGNYLKQITKDQTRYQLLLDKGECELAEKINKNEIIGCFGGGNKEYISSLMIYEIYGESKIYLLTTDGIHEYVDIDDLENGILLEDEASYSRRILERARNNGSEDDASILIVRM